MRTLRVFGRVKATTGPDITVLGSGSLAAPLGAAQAFPGGRMVVTYAPLRAN